MSSIHHLSVDLRSRQGGGWLASWQWTGEDGAGRPISGHGDKAFGAGATRVWCLARVEEIVARAAGG